MLDLSKPLGTHEGLVFYGDHETPNLVYYFPDEVSLATGSGAAGAEQFELFFQVFSEGGAITGSLDELQASSGSILSLGIQCSVHEERLGKAVEKLKAVTGLGDDLITAVPPWKDGSVKLFVLDKMQDAETASEDSFVKSIVGSNKPSLVGADLKSVFNVRLDRKGTSLVLKALQGGAGNVAGVLYDLTYTAMRPAVDLRIWANLGRCYESVSHHLGVKAEFYYGVKFSLGAEFEWITRKLEEEGHMKVELLSQVEDAATKQMVDEMVKEFKESVLREMFRPYVNPQTPNALPGEMPKMENNVPVVGVAYRFTKEKISHDKVIDVDYRERSAVTRTHNPQSHLWVFGKQIESQLSKYVQRVSFSELWREQELDIRLAHDFSQPDKDLLSAEVIVWRAKAGVLSNPDPGSFSIPRGEAPLHNSTFSKDKNANVPLAWTTETDEPVGYYYQLRLIFDATRNDISSPAEIITAPTFSSSRDLVIYPDTYTFFKPITIVPGAINFDEYKYVELLFELRNSDEELIDRERISLNKEQPSAKWTIRGKDRDNLFVTVSKAFYYRDDRPPITTTPAYLADDEIVINKPFLKSAFTLIPVIAGAKENVQEILLEILVQSPDIATPIKELYRIKAPAFDTSDLNINLHSEHDKLLYTVSVITTAGQIVELDKGILDKNALIIDLNKLGKRAIRFEWEGPPPAAKAMKRVRIEIRKTIAPNEEPEGFDFSGDAPAPVTKEFAGEQVEWRAVRFFNNGSKERTDYALVPDRSATIKISV